jgi:hypothetical protein
MRFCGDDVSEVLICDDAVKALDALSGSFDDILVAAAKDRARGRQPKGGVVVEDVDVSESARSILSLLKSGLHSVAANAQLAAALAVIAELEHSQSMRGPR